MIFISCYIEPLVQDSSDRYSESLMHLSFRKKKRRTKRYIYYQFTHQLYSQIINQYFGLLKKEGKNKSSSEVTSSNVFVLFCQHFEILKLFIHIKLFLEKQMIIETVYNIRYILSRLTNQLID